MSSGDEYKRIIDEELEHLYTCARWVVRMEPDKVVDDHLKITSERRENQLTSPLLDCELDIVYNQDDDVPRCLDIFKPKNVSADAPIFVYIHGGYWQALSKIHAAFSVLPLAKNGIVTIAVDYTIAPNASLWQMIKEVKQSIVFTSKKFPKSKGIYITGHSAGGHLAAMVLSVNWTKCGLPQDIIKGAVLISGVYDLTPLVKTSMNDALKFNEAEAKKLSPMIYTKEVSQFCKHCKIIVCVAEHDSPAFITQTKEYAKLLEDEGLDVTCFVIQDRDHFDIASDLMFDEYSLTKDLIKMINSMQ